MEFLRRRVGQVRKENRMPHFCHTVKFLLLLVLLAVVWGCSRSADNSEMAPLAAGQPLPTIQADGWLNVQGAPPTNEELAGKVVVIDVWAYWCGPCREDLPQMAKVYQQFRDQEVVFIGLTGEGADALAETKAAVAEANVPWPNGYGAMETLTKLEVKVLPTKLIIGRDGRIAWHNFMEGDFEDEISKALAKGA